MSTPFDPSTDGRWFKVEVYGLLQEGGELNVSELPASLGFERVVLVAVLPLDQVPTKTDIEGSTHGCKW